MKILFLSAFLATAGSMFAQEAAAPPPEVDATLRSRVAKFYQAYIDGKLNEAYTMVAPESQNKFIESGKAEYKECETVKIDYTENFTYATVNNSCKGEWHWQGHTSPSQLTVWSHWKLVDGQWLWYYVKPRTVNNPFAPNGVTVLPPDYDENATAKSIPSVKAVPTNMSALAKGILSKVSLDKKGFTVRADMDSKDEMHVRNEMPGEIRLALAPAPVAGMKITASKTTLEANETATITVEYSPDSKTIACGDCATRIRRAWVQLSIEPTMQTYQIEVNFTNQKSEQFPLPNQKQ